MKQLITNILPKDWKIIETVKNTIRIDRLDIFIDGVCAQNEHIKEMAIGSQASTETHREEIAYCELIERISTLDYFSQSKSSLKIDWMNNYLDSSSTNYQISRSNGISIHTDPEKAIKSAKLELLERHALLHSWYGGAPPKHIKRHPSQALSKISNAYESFYFELPNENGIELSMVVLFPKLENKPFVFGFGAELNLELAMIKAESEAIQRLAFLFEEEIEKTPEFSASPFYHQEIFLGSEGINKVQEWINGKNQTKLKNPIFNFAPTYSEIIACDITPEWLKHQFTVIKASGNEYIPLYFGNFLNSSILENYPELIIHPIS